MQYGVVILAGGKSKRMGTPKYRLRSGGLRFLDRLVRELGSFPELLISVDEESKHPDIQYPMVSDKTPDCGPISGLYSALEACVSDALISVPCDVPYFSKSMAEKLCARLDPATDAVIMVTDDQRIHPLCGVYKKGCQKLFAQHISQQNYRMQDALAKLRVKYARAGKDSWRLSNINTPTDFQAVSDIGSSRMEGQKLSGSCIAICGQKNSGKTTLIQNLIPILRKKGYTVAVIKHDGHSFEPDTPGTDSYRFFQAGADLSVVFDREKYALSRRGAFSIEYMIGLAHGADIILLEGLKRSDIPKIEVVRKENGGIALPDIRGRIAYVCDVRICTDLPVFELSDAQAVADFVIEAHKSGRLLKAAAGCQSQSRQNEIKEKTNLE